MLRGREKSFEALWKDSLKHPKDKTALNPEHRKPWTPTLVENLPDRKNQIEDNVPGWVHEPLAIVWATNQFFEELKATVLILQIFAKPEIQLQKQFKAHPSR